MVYGPVATSQSLSANAPPSSLILAIDWHDEMYYGDPKAYAGGREGKDDESTVGVGLAAASRSLPWAATYASEVCSKNSYVPSDTWTGSPMCL